LGGKKKFTGNRNILARTISPPYSLQGVAFLTIGGKQRMRELRVGVGSEDKFLNHRREMEDTIGRSSRASKREEN